ncbi:MAG: M48 family metallopeptidase [Richelia sp. CSU_2_1]|nr:M48 family metallopeptidase [Richelia sp. CSU_2_1]
MTDRNPPTSNKQLLIILGIFLALGCLLLWGTLKLVDGLILLIPPSVEQQLGALVVPAYERLAAHSPAQDTLDRLLERLETKLPKEQKIDRNYRLLYIPDDTANALALPGDTIIVYRGLIQQLESENELMMILGHELGHFANRDHLRAIGRGLALQLVVAVFVGDTGGFANIAAAIASDLSKAQFSRNQESQADEFGLKLLVSHYGHAAGATDFFQRLARENNLDIALLATHPAPGDRTVTLKQTIAQRRYPIRDLSPLPATLKAIDKSLLLK